MRLLKLVNDTNIDVIRVNAAMASFKRHRNPAKEKALKAIADRLITPKVRYSQPGLQTHVTYLYGETNFSDQKVGPDAIARYQQLRPQIDEITAELDRLLGPADPKDVRRYVSAEPSAGGGDGGDDDDE